MPRGLFESFTSENNVTDLFVTWANRSKVLAAERYRPYADLLLDQVLWPAMLVKKDDIFSALKAKCETATKPQDLQVPIWEYNFIQDLPKTYRSVQGPPQAYALEQGVAEAYLNQAIYNNLWHHTLAVEKSATYDDYEYYTLPVVGINKIINKTDVLTQLALRFGKNFRVVKSTVAIAEEHPKTGETYYRFKGVLYLQYFPYGLPEHFAKVQSDCEERIRNSTEPPRTLESGEVLEVNCA